METITIQKDYLNKLILIAKSYEKESDQRRKEIWLNQLLGYLDALEVILKK